MRRALSLFTMLVFLASTVAAAPSKPKPKPQSFLILNALIDCLLSKTKKSPSKKNISSTGSGITIAGAGTLVINGNSGTYSSGATVNVGNSAGALTILGTASGLSTQGTLSVPDKTVIAGQDVEFTLSSLLILSSTTYQWQRSTDQGATWTNLVDGEEISGSQTNKLTVRQVDKSMDGHLFKCLVYSNVSLNNPTVLPGLLTVL